MNIEGVVDAIVDLIKINLISKTILTANVNTGDTTINVENSFNFFPGEEIVLIDFGYNDESSEHYHVFEYAVIKSIIDTNTIVLNTPVISNWLLVDEAFIQKTIAHSPLYENNVLYGDREVIPTDEIAITVEPLSVSNDWIALQGLLNEDSKIQIMIYGQSVETEEGLRILNKYSKSVYDILNYSLHLNINDHQTPLIRDINIGDDTFCICDNEKNREIFIVGEEFSFQDNVTSLCTVCPGFQVINRTISGGEICLTIDCEFENSFSINEFAIAIKRNRYLYDSRVDSVTFGQVQKGSAILRAAQINWFGKETNTISFPQHDRKIISFDKSNPCDSVISP